MPSPAPGMHEGSESGSASDATTPESGRIRTFERSDTIDVAEMFGRIFRKGSPVRQTAVVQALEAVYLDQPGTRIQAGSLVHVGPAGRIDGFIGVVDVGMTIHDRPIRCGVLGAFMADRKANPSAVGARLVRAVLSRPYDLFFSDTASLQSLAIARALRFAHLPLGSLRWHRPLRPATVLATHLARRRPLVGFVAGPVARAFDAQLLRRGGRLGRPEMGEGLTDRPVSFEEFLLTAPDLTARYALRPAWGDVAMRWILAQAARSSADRQLHAREVLDAGGRRIGTYLVYTAADGLASALQVLALPRKEKLVYGAIVAWASTVGAAAISGVASPASVAGLAGQPGVYFRGGMSAIVRSGDPDVIRAIETGDHMLGGLVGETWSSVVADDFV